MRSQPVTRFFLGLVYVGGSAVWLGLVVLAHAVRCYDGCSDIPRGWIEDPTAWQLRARRVVIRSPVRGTEEQRLRADGEA